MSERRNPPPRDVDAIAALLPRDVAPGTDLWPGIASAIHADRLALAARALPTDVEPARDLWPEIRARIAAEPADGARRRARKPSWLAAAASLVTVTLIASLLAYVVTERPPASAELASTDDAWWVTLIERTPRGEEADARELRALLEMVRGEFVAVQSERIEIEAALNRDPSSTSLAVLWRHAYAQELALTSRAQEISNSFERGS